VTEPRRTHEVEVKFDVEVDIAVPDWTRVPGIATVGAAERRALDAVYLDTADAELGRSGYALRRRTGGPDAGWHVKGPRVGAGREELGWPLGDGGIAEVPAPGRAAIAHITDEPLSPLARIRNDRIAYDLLDTEGGVVAEFVDDHVTARDERAGVDRAWREWEIELGPAAPEDHEPLFAAIGEIARAAGASDASSDSKLARALGL
jgi:hypothetical protein